MFKIIVFILIYLDISAQSNNDYREDIINLDKEQELIDKLLKKYDKKSRPSGTLNVKFALNLNQIINLIEKDQIMILNAFIDHEWTDKRLTWSKLFKKFSKFLILSKIIFSIKILWSMVIYLL